MSDHNFDLFEKLIENCNTPEEREKLQKCKADYALLNDDPFWRMFGLLDYVLKLFQAVPEKIERSSKAVYEKLAAKVTVLFAEKHKEARLKLEEEVARVRQEAISAMTDSMRAEFSLVVKDLGARMRKKYAFERKVWAQVVSWIVLICVGLAAATGGAILTAVLPWAAPAIRGWFGLG